MSTERPRIQVTLDDKTSGMLATLAAEQNRSVSSVAAELINEALELHEDMYLSRLGDKRIEEDTGKRFTHDEAWQ